MKQAGGGVQASSACVPSPQEVAERPALARIQTPATAAGEAVQAFEARSEALAERSFLIIPDATIALLHHG